MSRLHSTLIALVLGAVAVAGLFAAVKTVRLGQKVSAPKPTVAAGEIASRQAKLDRWSRSLRQERAKRPPALPKLPTFAPVQAPPAASTAAPATAAPPVTYVRSKPMVKYQRAGRPSAATATSTQQTWSDDGAASDDSGQSDDGIGASSTGSTGGGGD